jgi:hypothetical protein
VELTAVLPVGFSLGPDDISLDGALANYDLKNYWFTLIHITVATNKNSRFQQNLTKTHEEGDIFRRCH